MYDTTLRSDEGHSGAQILQGKLLLWATKACRRPNRGVEMHRPSSMERKYVKSPRVALTSLGSSNLSRIQYEGERSIHHQDILHRVRIYQSLTSSHHAAYKAMIDVHWKQLPPDILLGKETKQGTTTGAPRMD